MLDFCVWECCGPTRVIDEGLKELAAFAVSLTVIFLVCDSLAAKRKSVSGSFSVASMARGPRKLGEKSPGLLGGHLWMGIHLFLCCLLSLWPQGPTVVVAVLRGREFMGPCIEHYLCLQACLCRVTESHITSLHLLWNSNRCGVGALKGAHGSKLSSQLD